MAACSTLPVLISWPATVFTVFDGTAKPTPTLPSVMPPVSICALTPITSPRALMQRPARVAVVDRRVRLDDVVDRVLVRKRGDLALKRADDPRRDRPAEAERIADGDDRVADLDGVGVAERKRRQRARSSCSPSARRCPSRDRSRRACASMLLLFENVTLIDSGALDHVVVRDDVAGLVEDEARAERALRLRASEGSTSGVGGGGDLHDAGRRALVDLGDRE